MTSLNAFEEFSTCSKLLKSVSKELKCADNEVVEKAASVMAENKELRKNVEKLKKQNMEAVLEGAIDNIGGSPFIVEYMVESSIKELKDGLDFIKSKLPDKVIALFSAADDQPTYAAYVPKQIASKIRAQEIIQFISAFMGGKGGGSPELAQGGGGDINKVHSLKHELVNFISNKLGA